MLRIIFTVGSSLLTIGNTISLAKRGIYFAKVFKRYTKFRYIKR